MNAGSTAYFAHVHGAVLCDYDGVRPVELTDSITVDSPARVNHALLIEFDDAGSIGRFGHLIATIYGVHEAVFANSKGSGSSKLSGLPRVDEVALGVEG